MTWQEKMVAELRVIDREQAPHGLYGMREALKERSWLYPLATLLFKKPPETNLHRRLGFKATTESYDDWANFTAPDNARVHLTLLTHATTKIRHYGGSYILDKVHGKKAGPHPDLESIVPKLTGQQGFPTTTVNALLFVAHAPTERKLMAVLDRAATPEFMGRYGVSLVCEVWEDIYQRGFHSGIFLWTAKSGWCGYSLQPH